MNPDQAYTMNDYIAVFKKRRGLFLSIAAPIAIIAAGLSLLLPDKYTSSAQIDIDLEGSNVRTLEPIELTTYADQYIAKLESRVMARENLLELANDNAVFGESSAAGDESERIEKIRDSAEVTIVSQPVINQNGREVDVISGFQVAASSSDPGFSHAVASFLSAEFLQADRSARTERASSTSTFLRDQMNKTEQEIAALEQQIAEFKVENACCLPELMDLNMAVIQRSEREIESLQPTLRALEKDRLFVQGQLDEFRKQTASTDRLEELEQEYLRLVANYGSDHPDVIRIRREITAMSSVGDGDGDLFELTELRMKLAEAEQRYSAEHPDVVRYKRQIASLEAKQAASSSAGPSSLRDNPRYQQLRAQLNALDSQLIELRAKAPVLREKIADYEQRLTRTPQIESEYQALNRQLEAARNNFDSLQERQIIARQTEAFESTEIGARLTEVRAARQPSEPSGPPRLAFLIIGVFAAATFGVFAFLMAEMTDATVRGSRDISMVMDMVPLATIPVIENSTTLAARRQQQKMLVSGAVLAVVAAAVLVYLRSIL